MISNNSTLFLAAGLAVAAGASQASIVSVVGPDSSLGTAPAIIAAPFKVLDDTVTNTGMQGFNEAQGVLLGAAINVDGGTVAAGTRVDSHMVFLNSAGNGRLGHFEVDWTFSGAILGVMSDTRKSGSGHHRDPRCARNELHGDIPGHRSLGALHRARPRRQ